MTNRSMSLLLESIRLSFTEGGRVVVSLTLDTNELVKLCIFKPVFNKCFVGQPFPNAMDYDIIHLKGNYLTGGF